MAYGRTGHTATLLQNGKVLVVGTGENGNAPAELYDPASGTWNTTGTVTDPFRVAHTATLLPNGKVLVAGGHWTNAMTAETAELYDPSTGTFTKTGNLIKRRAGHTATLLPNGTVLVAGGFWQDIHSDPTSIAEAEIYDPASGGWSVTAAMTAKRQNHGATLLPNGKVLVAGGYYFDGRSAPVIHATAELYDPTTGTWSPTGSLSPPRTGYAILLNSGKVLFVGSDGAELYDPASATWTTTDSLPEDGRGGFKATLLPGHVVLVAGGITGGQNGNFTYLRTAQLWDPATGRWRSTGNLLQPRTGHTATLLPNNKVLIAGGIESNGGPKLVTAELYTPPLAPPDLRNISTRLSIQTGDNAMIGGFIITGIEPKTVVVRGIGPSMKIAGALQDPVIELHGPSGELLATNDNWKDAADKQKIIDSGLAPTNDAESALWKIINPGAYTVVVKGKNDGTGVGLFEVYDLDQAADSVLGNVSTRGVARTGDDVMIGGIIVGGGSEGATARVVVRAIGPSLPVTGALPDPILEVRDSNGFLVAFNDNWKTRLDGTSQLSEIEATGIPPTNELESAVVLTVGPQRYTAIVRGKNNTSGVGLVEVYNLR